MGQILYLDHISIFFFLNVGKLWPDSTKNLCLSSLQTKHFIRPCSIILELSKWLKLLIRNLLYKFYNSSIADIHCTLFFIHIYSDILFTQVSHFNRRSF